MFLSLGSVLDFFFFPVCRLLKRSQWNRCGSADCGTDSGPLTRALLLQLRLPLQTKEKERPRGWEWRDERGRAAAEQMKVLGKA